MKEFAKRIKELERVAAIRLAARTDPDALTVGLHEIREDELLALAAELDGEVSA